MIRIVIRILYWCTLIKPSPAVDASLANITLIVKDYWSKFQQQKKALKKAQVQGRCWLMLASKRHLGILPHQSIRMRILVECLGKLLLLDIWAD